ncbi:MAG: adenylate kinase family protein [Methanobacteriota archaeon]
MVRLVVAVSGTPGTGKSVFSKILAKKLDAKLVNLKDLIEERKIYTLDKDGTKVVDVPKLCREFARQIRAFRGPVVVEGLLAHLLPKRHVTHVVVLRARPQVLERRLRARKYSEKKVRENLDAEALDIILWEAVETHGVDKVHEVDTTNLKAPKAVELFLRALEGKVPLRPGNIDWLEEHFKFE